MYPTAGAEKKDVLKDYQFCVLPGSLVEYTNNQG
jgi:hypothetical protein